VWLSVSKEEGARGKRNEDGGGEERKREGCVLKAILSTVGRSSLFVQHKTRSTEKEWKRGNKARKGGAVGDAAVVSSRRHLKPMPITGD